MIYEKDMNFKMTKWSMLLPELYNYFIPKHASFYVHVNFVSPLPYLFDEAPNLE